MHDPKLSVLREFVSAPESLVYAAVKAGVVDDLPHESQLYAKVETTFHGDPVSPSAHFALHAAV
jgi:hypothetical protein